MNDLVAGGSSMKASRHLAVLVATLVLTAVAAGAAWAGAPTDQLRGNVDRVLRLVSDPVFKEPGRTKERRREVRKIADDFFAFDETAKRSLGRHWRDRTPAERHEFVQLFSELLERSYFTKIELYGGEKIRYVGEVIDGDQATVKTKILTKQESEIPVDYRMMKRGEKWVVYDVIIEGVSLISNYRTQFNKIIQTVSYQELVKKIKAKDTELTDQDGKAKRTSQRDGS
jgi:phospholipid transport system substrate-binding protein